MRSALRLEETCPKCGSHLMMREGENGDFLACPRFPSCRFTKPLLDNDLKIYRKSSPYCEKCNHTGLLPFVKNKKLIPYAFVDCECKLSLGEHIDPVRLSVEDFDFPMSDTFRGFSYEYCGQLDPGYIPLVPKEHSTDRIQEPKPRAKPQLVEKWTKSQWHKVLSMEVEMERLRRTAYKYLKEMREMANASKRKPKSKY